MKKGAIPLCLAMAVISAPGLSADAVGLYGSGKAFQDREDWYSAIESYQEALHENPSYGAAYANLAECFYAIGEYEQALDQVTKAESFRKGDPSLMDLHTIEK